MAIANTAITGLLKFKKIVPAINSCVVRFKSKKSAPGGTKPGNHGKPGKHGWKRQDNAVVTNGTILATQYNLRFCPGLNVGAGKRGELYAKVPGRVKISCEKVDFNTEHGWIKKWYPNREGVMYKKYFNVIADPQPNTFKLVEQI